MSVHKKIEGKPLRFPENPELEEEIRKYLANNKDAYTTMEVRAIFATEDPDLVREALYNLRNKGFIRIVTFETNRIYWMHQKWIG